MLIAEELLLLLTDDRTGKLLYEADKEIVSEVEAPGFEEDQLTIEATDHTLLVKGVQTEESALAHTGAGDVPLVPCAIVLGSEEEPRAVAELLVLDLNPTLSEGGHLSPWRALHPLDSASACASASSLARVYMTDAPRSRVTRAPLALRARIGEIRATVEAPVHRLPRPDRVLRY